MSALNNQKDYWNKAAHIKTFTHPPHKRILRDYFKKDFTILDYGCGYGRLAEELHADGFSNITAVDTSLEMIKRGKALFPHLSLIHINDVQALHNFGGFDAVLLFAVLTCIPSNAGQTELVGLLQQSLKKGGFLYISDYYLQHNTIEVKEYGFLNNDAKNYGVFSLSEGVSFRHHTKEWIKELLQHFEIISEKLIPVKTMNGHSVEAFQILARK